MLHESASVLICKVRKHTSSVGIGYEVDNLVTDIVSENVWVLPISTDWIQEYCELTWLKTLIVFVYSFNRFVDQEGEDRSIDPFIGSETSNLGVSAFHDTVENGSHDIYPSVLEHLHTLVVIETGIDRVDSDGVYAELLKVGDIPGTVGS